MYLKIFSLFVYQTAVKEIVSTSLDCWFWKHGI